jgi:hypothetical protein
VGRWVPRVEAGLVGMGQWGPGPGEHSHPLLGSLQVHRSQTSTSLREVFLPCSKSRNFLIFYVKFEGTQNRPGAEEPAAVSWWGVTRAEGGSCFKDKLTE